VNPNRVVLATLRPMMSRTVLSLAAAGLLALPAASSSSATLHTCPLTVKEQQGFGVTYVTSLKVRGVTCATGKRVVRSFQACRKAHGGLRGYCPRSTPILGFHCAENRGGVPTQFTSKVTCTKATRRVVFTYTQNT
jgi:hypothetical protein